MYLSSTPSPIFCIILPPPVSLISFSCSPDNTRALLSLSRPPLLCFLFTFIVPVITPGYIIVSQDLELRFTNKWEHTAFVFLNQLPNSVYFSSSIHLPKIFIFLYIKVDFHCVCEPHFHYLFTSWWTFRVIHFLAIVTTMTIIMADWEPDKSFGPLQRNENSGSHRRFSILISRMVAPVYNLNCELGVTFSQIIRI